MEKLEFLTKLEEVKNRLPVGAVPLYMKAYPDGSESRVKNTIAGKVRDEEILLNLEKIAKMIEAL